MAETVKVVVFKNEAEAYKKFSDIKNGLVEAKDYILSEMVILKKVNGSIQIREAFDTGIETTNDTSKGFWLGTLVGIIGGPIGMLLGGATGSLTGSIIDMSDAADNKTIIEKVSEVMNNNEMALVALVGEAVTNSFDSEFSDTQVEICSADAAEVMAEVEEAKRVEKALQNEAKNKMREEKKAERKQKIEEYRNELKAKFEKRKEKR